MKLYEKKKPAFNGLRPSYKELGSIPRDFYRWLGKAYKNANAITARIPNFWYDIHVIVWLKIVCHPDISTLVNHGGRLAHERSVNRWTTLAVEW